MDKKQQRALKVLIADPEPFVRDTLKTKLRSKGYDVLVTDNGRDMVRMAGREYPDMIVTEINFQDVDTLRALQILKGNERTKNVPIIILTRDEITPEKQFLFAPHVVRFMAKPFSPRKVAKAIQEVFSNALI